MVSQWFTLVYFLFSLIVRSFHANKMLACSCECLWLFAGATVHVLCMHEMHHLILEAAYMRLTSWAPVRAENTGNWMIWVSDQLITSSIACHWHLISFQASMIIPYGILCFSPINEFSPFLFWFWSLPVIVSLANLCFIVEIMCHLDVLNTCILSAGLCSYTCC